MIKAINFTKAEINKLPTPNKGLFYYKDTKEKGLSLYITANRIITFFIRKRINGKDERVLIGSFPEITVENARKKARIIKGQVAQGINPNSKKDEIKQEITFAELFSQFMERYSKKEKKSWKYDEREVNKFLSHWFKRKVSTITNQEIRLLHEKTRDENGLYQANRLLERIRVIYNKAIEWGYKGDNPTNNINKFKEKSRDRFIQPDELPRFFQALEEEENKVAKDYIYTSLYTGARKGNVLAMKWEQINFTTKQWRISDPKNGEPLTIPLSDLAINILKRRKIENKKLELTKVQYQWVFPSLSSSSGHLADPKKAWKRVLQKADIKDLRLHDIRRTLGSYQAISGASTNIIQKTLGHKSQAATAIYARMNLDPVRQSMDKALDLINSYKN